MNSWKKEVESCVGQGHFLTIASCGKLTLLQSGVVCCDVHRKTIVWSSQWPPQVNTFHFQAPHRQLFLQSDEFPRWFWAAGWAYKKLHHPQAPHTLIYKIDIENQQFHTKLYDKCDSFNFSIINFPFVEESNIPEDPSYGVYCSRLISIARACDSIADFKECTKLMRQGFQYKRLSKQLKKTLGKHKELFSKCMSSIEVSLPINAYNIWHVTIRC